jgi:hypothetical protein
MKYVFSGQPELRQTCEGLLRVAPNSTTPERMLGEMLQLVRTRVAEGLLLLRRGGDSVL